MDTRSPFVVGIHDVMRRPGTMRTLELEAPAPADLAIEVIGVPEGAPIQVELRLDSVVEGILVTGRVQAPLAGECVRCLNQLSDAADVTFTELFAYPGALEIDPDDEDADEVYEVSGENLDVEQAVRDAVVLALPFQPYCRPDCLGLCPECGVDLNEAPADHGHDVIDARWAALVSALDPSEDSADAESDEPTDPTSPDSGGARVP